MSTFVERFEELADEKGVTTAKVLRDCQLGKNNMFKWKTRGSKPSKVTLKVLADYFNVPVDYLLGDSDERYQHITQMVNSINQSPNANLTINNNLTPQEIELIDIFRSLSLNKQIALVTFMNSLKEDK